MPASGRSLIRLLTALVCATALCLLLVVLLPFDPVRTRLDAVAGDGSADLYTPAVHLRFRVGAALLLAITVAAAGWLGKNNRRLGLLVDTAGQRLQDDRRRCRARLMRLVRHQAGWLVLVTLLATGLRLPYLDQPLRYDEAHTFVKYASLPALLIVTRYDEPNNHILHSLGVRAATKVFGGDPWAIRLPALLCGILLAPVTLLWGAAVAGRWPGILAGLLVASHSQLIEFSVNARGYTLAGLLFLITCWSAREALRQRNLWAAVIAVPAMSLSLWTVPTMIYGAIPLAVWLLLDARFARTGGAETESATVHRSTVHRLRPIVICLLAAGLLTAVLYLPVLLALGPARLAGVAGESMTFGAFVWGLPTAGEQLVGWMLRDLPAWFRLLLALGCLVALLAGGRRRRRRRWRAVIAGGSILLVLLLQRVIPPERVWTFAVPPLLLLATVGWSDVLQRLRRAAGDGPWQRAVMPGAVLALGAVSSIVFLAGNSIRTSDQTGTFPEAEEIAADLQGLVRPDEPVIAVTPASAPLVYYARRRGLAESHFMPAGQGHTDDRSAIIICSRTFDQTPAELLEQLSWEHLFAADSATVLRTYPGAAIYRVPARAP